MSISGRFSNIRLEENPCGSVDKPNEDSQKQLPTGNTASYCQPSSPAAKEDLGGGNESLGRGARGAIAADPSGRDDSKPQENGGNGWNSNEAPPLRPQGWSEHQMVEGVKEYDNRGRPIAQDSRRGDHEPRELIPGESCPEPSANPEASRQVVEGLFEGLNNVDVKLADKQADVNSPLYSVKTFGELGLREELLKGIYSMKFVKPSKVQERALPLLLSDPPQNMIAQSQSGTGKTAAFVLTMLHRVDTSISTPQAICITPTRELARQIVDVISQMGQFTSITTAMCSREDGPRRDAVNAQILVGTPGTLLEMERRRLVDLSGIRVYVLDEADVMLDKQGMGLQSMRLRKLCPDTCQMLLFSATFSDAVMEFAHMIVPTANEIALKREEVSVDSIKQFYIECQSYPHKIEMLSLIYGLLTIGQSIVFIATRDSAEEVKARMLSEGHRVSLIHGGMTPQERDIVIDDFRQGRTKVLLATNVLARGIDVLQVSLVVNFDLPMTAGKMPDPETYVHRIGRTGRFGRKGVAINFIHNRMSADCLSALQSFFGREIIRMPTDSIELLEQKLQSISRSSTAVAPSSDVPRDQI